MTTFSPTRPARTEPRRDERRGHARYACSLRTAGRLLAEPEGTSWTADTRDLSQEGMGLVFSSPLKRGTVLIARLEGVSAMWSRPILLRVVRCTAEPGGGWLVGCTIIKKLSKAELSELLGSQEWGTSPAVGPDPVSESLRRGALEQRSSPRRKGTTLPVLLARLEGSNLPIDGWVLDRSLGGLGLSVVRPFARGTVLWVRPANAAEGVPWVRVLVRNCRPTGRNWVVGCQFEVPPDAEVRAQFG